jgi:hypothetical protein
VQVPPQGAVAQAPVLGVAVHKQVLVPEGVARKQAPVLGVAVHRQVLARVAAHKQVLALGEVAQTPALWAGERQVPQVQVFLSGQGVQVFL